MPRPAAASSATPRRCCCHAREHPRLPGAWYCGEPQLVSDIIRTHGAAIAINPQLRLAATLVPTTTAERAGLAPRTAHNHPTICLVSDLAACRLDEKAS